MIFEKGTKLYMTGDSVTDSYHEERPVEEGLYQGKGRGYVSVINCLLDFAYPDSRIKVVNMGGSGITTRNLLAHWQNHIIKRSPDWVSVMIGINDVWEHFKRRLPDDEYIHLDEYERNLESLVQQTLYPTPPTSRAKGMILLSPYYVEPDTSDPMRAMMDQYGAAVKRVAQKHGCLFIDTQAMFDGKLKNANALSLAWDRVHPTSKGHILLAAAFLSAIGFEWPKPVIKDV